MKRIAVGKPDCCRQTATAVDCSAVTRLDWQVRLGANAGQWLQSCVKRVAAHKGYSCVCARSMSTFNERMSLWRYRWSGAVVHRLLTNQACCACFATREPERAC